LLSFRSKVAVLSGLPASRRNAISNHFESDIDGPDYTDALVRTNNGVSKPIPFGSTLVQKSHIQSSALANVAANVAANVDAIVAANVGAYYSTSHASANVAANATPYVAANSTPYAVANSTPYVCVSPSVWFSVS